MVERAKHILNAIASRALHIIAAVITALVGAGVVVFSPPPLVDLILHQDIRDQSRMWAEKITRQVENSRTAFALRGISSTDQTRLIALTTASEVVRIRLYDREGTVFWSSHASDFGRQIENVMLSALREQAAPVLHWSTVRPNSARFPQQLESDPYRDKPRTFVTVYTPIIRGHGFEGVIGYSKDITVMRTIFIERMQMTLAVIVGMGFIALIVVMLLSLRNGKITLAIMQKRASREHKLLKEQTRLSRELKLLRDLNQWVQTAQSLDEVFEVVAAFMRTMLPNTEGSLYLYAHSRDALDGVVSWGDGYLRDVIKPDDCWGMRRGTTYAFDENQIAFPCAHKRPGDTRASLCFPILAHGEAIGLIHIVAKPVDGQNPLEETKDLARSAAEQISMAISNVRLRDALHDQSVRDPLTGLHNRRYITDALRAALTTKRRKSDHLAVVSLDIDHFKRFNDNHGHDAGDMVLRAVGTALEEFCQPGDVAGRTGGEEFILMWPNLADDAARARGEALRQRIGAIVVRYGSGTLPNVSASIGIAIAPRDGRTPQHILRAADDALYRAKRGGRDQVVMVSTPPDSDPRPEPDAPAHPPEPAQEAVRQIAAPVDKAA